MIGYSVVEFIKCWQCRIITILLVISLFRRFAYWSVIHLCSLRWCSFKMYMCLVISRNNRFRRFFKWLGFRFSPFVEMTCICQLAAVHLRGPLLTGFVIFMPFSGGRCYSLRCTKFLLCTIVDCLSFVQFLNTFCFAIKRRSCEINGKHFSGCFEVFWC